MTADDVLDAIDRLADEWGTQRSDRFERRHLEVDDFAALADTGFLRMIVPESHGGMWTSMQETGPIIIDAIRRLARGDQSVALVASMHPAVVGLWTVAPEAPDPFTELWEAQRSEVFQSALDGHFWGTVTSEPGSGGDILRTRTAARPVEGSAGRYTLHGEKHFASGFQIASFMLTTAKPDDLDIPLPLYLDLRDRVLDGTDGISIAREWDGMGMKATQSHAVTLDGIDALAFAWPGVLAEAAPIQSSFGIAMFSAVALSIVDAAMAETTRRLIVRDLRPYEDVTWTDAEVEHWLMTQAHDGLVRSIVESSVELAAIDGLKAKIGVATLAESIMSKVCRVVGGGAFSSSSPFATWYEDVRALGYLRPPWGLAFDNLIENRRPPSEP